MEKAALTSSGKCGGGVQEHAPQHYYTDADPPGPVAHLHVSLPLQPILHSDLRHPTVFAEAKQVGWSPGLGLSLSSTHPVRTLEISIRH